VEFQERLTIDAALKRASELRAADFTRITLINVISGIEITDLEGLLEESGTDGSHSTPDENSAE
jgi:hypothetical protein